MNKLSRLNNEIKLNKVIITSCNLSLENKLAKISRKPSSFFNDKSAFDLQ